MAQCEKYGQANKTNECILKDYNKRQKYGETLNMNEALTCQELLSRHKEHLYYPNCVPRITECVYIQTTKYKVLSVLSDVCKCDGRMNEMSLYCE